MDLRVSTIKEYINNYNSDEFTFDKSFLKEVLIKDDGLKIVINDTQVFDDYLDEIDSKTYYVTMDNEKLNYYKFNPKLFSYDIYGTTELWFMILQMNEMHSCCEFNRNTIKVVPTTIVNTILEIFELEKNMINSNYEEISEVLNN